MCKDHFKDLTIVGPHNHPFSLDSGNSVKNFIKAAAKDFGRKAIAITDHGTMGAIIEAHEYAKDLKKKENLDIKIIPGIEIYLLPDNTDDSGCTYYHVTVHFDDFDSYLEGCKISKSSFDRAVWKGAELKPLVTWEELESLSGKVTLFSSCLVGAVLRPWTKNRKDIGEKNFVRLMNIAGKGRFFSEIFPYEVSKNWNGKEKKFEPIKEECSVSGMMQVDANKWIMNLSQKYGVPMVISEDAHYAHEEDKFIQDARLNKDGKGTWKMSDANCLHSTEWLYKEMSRLHPEYINEVTFKEMIDNSYAFLGNFKGFEPKFKPSLPRIMVQRIDGNVKSERELTGNDELVNHALQSIVNKGRIDLNDAVYAQRLEKELQQLAYNGKVNILPYFLTLNTIVDFCEKNDVLVGPGRGSAAGSLLSYALGITSVDPIKEELSFERFFDVTRVEDGLADIDMDFSDRNKVVDFIKSNWGDKFAYLGTGTTFKTKSALKDIDRFLHGEVRKETEDVCKMIPQSPQGIEEEDFLRGYTDNDGEYHAGELEKNEKLIEYLSANTQMAEYLFKMIGIVRQMGRHAAGVLIADRPVHHFIPLTKVSDEPTTQLLPKWVEKCGGIKYDILGLNTLEDIRICLNHIKTRHGKTIDPWKLKDSDDFWEFSINSPATIFQLHTNTVRKGFQTMRPHGVQEAAILTSVFRPGAMDAISDEDPSKTMADIFLERWTGKREVNYVHPDLELILSPTKGIIVYQEQIMKIVHDLGGLSMPETNKLRKAISKKAGDDLMKLLQKVKANMIEKGWSELQAQTVCDQMKASGRYCFNKSHAVSYCYIARACAYLKYHYPIEWWCAVLTNATKDDLKKYWNNISSIILPPDINASTDKFDIVQRNGNDFILSPLSMIEGVGPSIISEIAEKRPFISLSDMMMKVDRRKVNKGPMVKLIFSGILDSLIENSAQMKRHEKISAYFREKAALEGKKTPESVPMEYIEMTPLKDYLLNKSIYKVYNADLAPIAIPKLESLKKIRKIAKDSEIYVYDYSAGESRIIVNKAIFDSYVEASKPAALAIIGYVVDKDDKSYQNGTKSAAILTVEVEDKTYEFRKWPKWGSNTHDVPSDVKESVCVICLSRRKDGQDFFVDYVDILENLSFLKDKENEDGERKVSKTKKRTRGTTGASATQS